MHKPFRSSLWILLIFFCLVAPEYSRADQDSSALLLRLVGPDGGERSVTREDWGKLPRTSVKAKDHGGDVVNFEGVPARELLKLVAAPSGHELRGRQLTLYVVAEATDGYKVVYALPEFDPDFTDGVILIADRRNGETLPPKEGPLRLVVPWEKREARWIRQLTVLRLGQAP
jgi:DMSO/TMAO reductase YedYZ molybdopterin-dependent catalytic subunit